MKTTKTIFLLIALSVMMISQVSAQDPTLDWVVQMGGVGQDEGRSIAIDNNGNVITTGLIKGNVTCTLPGQGGIFNLTTVGSFDVFIQKLGTDGSHLWTKHCGGSGTAYGEEVTADPSGNIIVMGNFSGMVDFDPGPGVFNMTSHSGAYAGTATFILKLDANGNFLWAKQNKPDYGSVMANSLTRDINGNLIITGRFNGKVDFDPGSGTTFLSPGADYQIFIWKLDAEGNFQWVNELGGNNENDYGFSIATDASGNIYTTGAFSGSVDFDPSKRGTFTLTSKGLTDVFIQKLGPNGTFLWAKQMGGINWDYGFALTRDAGGNLYTSGYFVGTVDFDPGPGIFNLTTTSNSNFAFIQKLDAAGNFVWAKQVEGTGTLTNWSGIKSINTDAGGNVYTTGYFGGSADFDPGSGTFIKTCIDTVDCFILKLDENGIFQWARQMGGNGSNFGSAINTDINGNIYTAGFFSGDALGFDPYNPAFQLHSNGYRDYFLQKLNQGAVCYAPSGLIANNISYNSATLNWNAVEGAGSYNVRYGVGGSGNWITENGVTLTSLPVSGLTPATAYDFQVQTNCGESLSVFSASATFTTLGPECNDSYEPNETQAAAKTIAVNTDIRALIAVSGDLDWFKFNNTNKNRNIKITLTNLPANYDVALYNSAGVQLGISQNTGTASELITFNTSILGTYYVKVYGNAGVYNPYSCYMLKASLQQTSYKSVETGAPDDEVAMNISVYPNPASNQLNFDFNSSSACEITARLTESNGRVIHAYNFDAILGKNLYTIDLSETGNGLYFLVLTAEGQNYIRKVIINK